MTLYASICANKAMIEFKGCYGYKWNVAPESLGENEQTRNHDIRCNIVQAARISMICKGFKLTRVCGDHRMYSSVCHLYVTVRIRKEFLIAFFSSLTGILFEQKSCEIGVLINDDLAC